MAQLIFVSRTIPRTKISLPRQLGLRSTSVRIIIGGQRLPTSFTFNEGELIITSHYVATLARLPQDLGSGGIAVPIPNDLTEERREPHLRA